MNKIKYLIVGILVVIITFGCDNVSYAEPIADIKTLTAEEAKIELESDDSIVLLDVRYQEEYDKSNLVGSILIPLDELLTRINEEVPNKNTRIFVYCQSGKRSEYASDILVSLGYKNIYNVEGLDYW